MSADDHDARTFLRAAKRFDLHLHTVRSDGGVTEEALLRLAAARGLDVVAITDHDIGPSQAPGPKTFGDRTVWLLHGAEVSAVHEGHEIHVLCFFPGAIPATFTGFLRERVAARRDRYIRGRARFGLPEPEDDGRAWTRFHLAKDLADAKLVPNMSAAFAGPLRLRPPGVDGTASPEGVDPFGVPIAAVLDLVSEVGGVSVWAHPKLEQAVCWAGAFRQLGMWGLESARPGLGKSVRGRLHTIAHKAGLGITGGSDWHGRGGDVGVFSFPRREAQPFVNALVG